MIEGTGSVGSPADGAHVLYEQRIKQLKGELKLAEEGLANYAQENERLKGAIKHMCEELCVGSPDCQAWWCPKASVPQSGKQA